MGRELNILIAGSRKFDSYIELSVVMDNLINTYKSIGGFSKFNIVSGGALGADTLAERYAKDRNLEMVIFPADWEKHGKSAGFIRNEQMHKYIASKSHRAVVCFWSSEERSKGTSHNFDLCIKYNNPLFIWDFYSKKFIQN